MESPRKTTAPIFSFFVFANPARRDSQTFWKPGQPSLIGPTPTASWSSLVKKALFAAGRFDVEVLLGVELVCAQRGSVPAMKIRRGRCFFMGKEGSNAAESLIKLRARKKDGILPRFATAIPTRLVRKELPGRSARATRVLCLADRPRRRRRLRGSRGRGL